MREQAPSFREHLRVGDRREARIGPLDTSASGLMSDEAHEHRVQLRAHALATEKISEAQAALKATFAERRAVLGQHSPKAWLFKRGGRAKTWKKRFCVIDKGVMYYYGLPSERDAGKPALGALVLRNAQARRPTDLASKGKHKHTCFRIDLDQASQASVVSAMAAAEEPDEDDDEGAAADSKGRPGKAKWIFAAETQQGMADWMEDISFWSAEGMRILEIDLEARKAGKTLSEAQVAAIKEAALKEAQAEVPPPPPAPAAADDEPLPSMADIETLSMAALRQLITKAGLATDDCLEKAEVRTRAREALAALGVSAPSARSTKSAADAAGGAGDEGEGGEEEEEEAEGEDDEDGDEGQAAQVALAQLSVGDANADDDDEAPHDVTDATATSAAPEEAAPPPAPVDPKVAEKAELSTWTAFALSYQLRAMGETVGDGDGVADLSERYWDVLVKAGKESEDTTRRFLLPPAEAASATDTEPLTKLWIGCVLGTPLEDGPLMPQLRDGEVLCDLLNTLRNGLVPKIARAAEMADLHVSKKNAQMRENIGQYVDGCAELGLPQRDLFMTADLFDDKDPRAVLRHLEGLARFAQEGVPGFVGPFIGKKAIKKKAFTPHAGVTGSGAAQGRVILSGGASGGKYQAFVSGRGNM